MLNICIKNWDDPIVCPSVDWATDDIIFHFRKTGYLWNPLESSSTSFIQKVLSVQAIYEIGPCSEYGHQLIQTEEGILEVHKLLRDRKADSEKEAIQMVLEAAYEAIIILRKRNGAELEDQEPDTKSQIKERATYDLVSFDESCDLDQLMQEAWRYTQKDNYKMALRCVNHAIKSAPYSVYYRYCRIVMLNEVGASSAAASELTVLLSIFRDMLDQDEREDFARMIQLFPLATTLRIYGKVRDFENMAYVILLFCKDSLSLYFSNSIYEDKLGDPKSQWLFDYDKLRVNKKFFQLRFDEWIELIKHFQLIENTNEEKWKYIERTILHMRNTIGF